LDILRFLILGHIGFSPEEIGTFKKARWRPAILVPELESNEISPALPWCLPRVISYYRLGKK